MILVLRNCMNLVKEYKNQSTWRDWSPYIERLPIDNQDTIFDFGCSLGIVTKLLAKKASYVIGIENNPEVGSSSLPLATMTIKHLHINLCRCFLFCARFTLGFDSYL